MPNRNNKTDLVKFFVVTGGIICGIIALIAYGYASLDGKYFKELDTKITNYFQQQWNLQP